MRPASASRARTAESRSEAFTVGHSTTAAGLGAGTGNIVQLRISKSGRPASRGRDVVEYCMDASGEEVLQGRPAAAIGYMNQLADGQRAEPHAGQWPRETLPGEPKL